MLSRIDPTDETVEYSEDIRMYVREREDGLCIICARQGGHVHHIIFRSQGGTHNPNNLCLLCHDCHERMHGPNPLDDDTIRKMVRKNEKRLRNELI
jgi:5-methylcytosine-specific restriction endonuclease McrA